MIVSLLVGSVVITGSSAGGGLVCGLSVGDAGVSGVGVLLPDWSPGRMASTILVMISLTNVPKTDPAELRGLVTVLSLAAVLSRVVVMMVSVAKSEVSVLGVLVMVPDSFASISGVIVVFLSTKEK